MSFQFLNPAPVFLNLPGTAPLSGGEIFFYVKGAVGSETLKDTWADEALTVLNENPVPLDSAGRTETPIWLDGEYSVVIKASDGTTIATRDYTSGAGASATIPDLDPGFLTNDGLNLQWQVLREVPDPTGFTNRILSTDGANLLWIEQAEAPVIPDPEIVITGNSAAGSFRAGVSSSAAKYFRQWGGGTAPSNPGGKTTSVAITYPTPFDATPRVVITPVGSSFTNAGYMTDFGVTSESASGFTASFNTNHGESNSDGNINVSIPFNWSAEGIKTVEPAP